MLYSHLLGIPQGGEVLFAIPPLEFRKIKAEISDALLI